MELTLCLHKTGLSHLIDGGKHASEHACCSNEEKPAHSEGGKAQHFAGEALSCKECVDFQLQGNDPLVFIASGPGATLPKMLFTELAEFSCPHSRDSVSESSFWNRAPPLHASLSRLHTQKIVLLI